MNTFLPYLSHSDSARVLDNKRLGKQRVEVLQILRALLGQTKGWVNHPATKMWRGYEYGLAFYGLIICDEWIKRGFKDTCKAKIEKLMKENPEKIGCKIYPSWLNEAFCLRHRSNLLRKNPEHYRKISGWENIPDNLSYIWPVK